MQKIKLNRDKYKAISHDLLTYLFRYEPETGDFVRAKPRQGASVGEVAGCIVTNPATGKKYRHIGVNGEQLMAHRLAWFYVHGTWPVGEIDHIDGNSLNNAIANLREATRSQNSFNRGQQVTNTSGFKGVCWHKNRCKWAASITVDRKQKHLGYFPTAELAHAAYCEAAKKLHGDFANFGVAA